MEAECSAGFDCSLRSRLKFKTSGQTLKQGLAAITGFLVMIHGYEPFDIRNLLFPRDMMGRAQRLTIENRELLKNPVTFIGRADCHGQLST